MVDGSKQAGVPPCDPGAWGVGRERVLYPRKEIPLVVELCLFQGRFVFRITSGIMLRLSEACDKGAVH